MIEKRQVILRLHDIPIREGDVWQTPRGRWVAERADGDVELFDSLGEAAQWSIGAMFRRADGTPALLDLDWERCEVSDD